MPGNSHAFTSNAAIGVVLSIAGCVVLAAQADTVRLVEGGAVTGELVSIDAEVIRLRAADGMREIPVGSAIAVELEGGTSESLMSAVGRRVAFLEDGSRMGLERVTIAGGNLKGRSALAGEMLIPVRMLYRLLLPSAHERPLDVAAIIEPLHLKRGDQDILVVRTPGGDAVTLPGIVLRLGEKEIVLDYEGVESPMPLATVRAIQTATAPGAGITGKPVATVLLNDGSRVAVESVEGQTGSLVLVSRSLGSIKVARGAVCSIAFRGERLVSLADLDPKAEQTPFFDEQFPWQRNKAVHGGPLQLDGRLYEQGIGMHARCRLEFALEGAYRVFTATAGIDDSVRAGKVRLTVSVDGKPAAIDITLDRAGGPRVLNLDLSGARKMIVVADFVDGTMGSGARVNLCNAMLRK